MGLQREREPRVEVELNSAHGGKVNWAACWSQHCSQVPGHECIRKNNQISRSFSRVFYAALCVQSVGMLSDGDKV
ncbi:hypothetical protein RRG08_033107 [Elysia crispata]|uniref:Uncharacterized protein n=1 Tax=Elysia crispata TaxID=231223 RepID=A0AAE1EDZ7_9GAST|nr:hypothetical protein RRG08_033107 [Elysia crispata]